MAADDTVQGGVAGRQMLARDQLLFEVPHLGRRHYVILLFAWSAWLFGFFSLMLFSFLMPQIEAAFHPSELELAWLTGVAIGMTGLGGLVFGWLSDHAGRRRSIWIAVLTLAAGNALAATAQAAWALAAARAVTGLGVGGTWGAGQALVAETCPPKVRGRFGALAQSGAPLGLGLAAVIGSFVAPALGWREVLACSSLPVLVLAALLCVVPESDVWLMHPRRTSIVRELLGRAALGLFARCFVLTLLNMCSYWFTVTWLPRYLQLERGLSVARSGLSTLAFVAGSLLGYLCFGVASDRMGRRGAFSLFCGLMACGLAMFTVFWQLIAAHPRLVLGFMWLAGVGTGTWSSYGPMFSELFPTRVRGTAMSVIMNSTRGVQFLTPVVIAAVAPRWGMAGGIALAAGFALLCGAWIWVLPETRGRRITF